jgi:6-carboxyhexanoate--CoA ligase
MRGKNYSIRMHASAEAKHVSGAERIVAAEQIDRTVSELIDRAMNKISSPDRITVTIEDLGTMPIRTLTALDVITVEAADPAASRSIAAQVLLQAGIANHAIDRAFYLLNTGAAPSGENMRGAMIMDRQGDERLEPDAVRGVRASRFDWNGEAGNRIRQQLADKGLSHFRTYEALALATKIAHGPGVLAELCWSDDPDYTAGYVASLRTGYVRFPFFKKRGDKKGGRVVFVDSNGLNVEALIHYLQAEAVLITDIGICNIVEPAAYFARLSG